MKKLFFIMGAAAIVFASCSKTEKPKTNNSGTDTPDKPVEVVVTDLNSENPETANCYMIHKAGRYAFNATVMGNGDAGTKLANGSANTSVHVTSTAIEPKGAKLVWEEVSGLITDVELKDGKLLFTCDKVDGNAVVAATDAAGKVLWSWHIWSTIAPETVKVEYSYPANPETGYAGESGYWEVMDRNLGAYNKSVGTGEDSWGMFYQWGRKDPFSYLRMDKSLAEGKFHPTAGSQTVKDDANTIAYSIEHPETFLTGYQYAADADQRSWIYSENADQQKAYNNLWGNNFTYACYPAKTIYDPCPAGYQVATHEFYRFTHTVKPSWDLTAADGSLTLYKGLVIPMAGIINYTFEHIASDTSVWNDSSAWGGNDKSFRVLKGTNDPQDQTGRGRAIPVRCMKTLVMP